MQNFAVIITVFLLLGANLTIMTANAQDLISRTPYPAEVYDLDGNLLDRMTLGHQVILSKTFVNYRNVPQPYVALFEVRDSDGVTLYIAWQSSTMAAGGQTEVGVSWIADGIGVHQIRTFLISNFTNPEFLDAVESRSISVVDNASA